MKDRLGEVYTLYRRFIEIEKKKPTSLYDLAAIFRLKEEFSFSRNVHNISNISEDEKEQSIELASIIFDNNLDLEYINSSNAKLFSRRIIYRLLSSNVTPDQIKEAFKSTDNNWNSKFINKFSNYLENMYESGNYNHIKARFNDPRLFVFDHFYKDQILHTNLSYNYRFNEVFTCPEHWDYLFIVADTGRALKDSSELLKKVHKKLTNSHKIYLITCLEAIKKHTGGFEPMDTILEEHLKKFNEEGSRLQNKVIHKTLPYPEHNHHITIFLKKINNEPIYQDDRFPVIEIEIEPNGKTEKYICIRSIYLYKRGFSNEVNPLWVRGALGLIKNPGKEPQSHYNKELLEKDHLMLLETFYAYHRKAVSFENSDGKYLEYVLPKSFNIPDAHNKPEIEERRFKNEDLFTFIKNVNPINQFKKTPVAKTDTSSNTNEAPSTSLNIEQKNQRGQLS